MSRAEKKADSIQITLDFIDLLPSGFYQATKQGMILSANIAAAQILGFEHRDEIIGKNISDFYTNINDRIKMHKVLLDNGGKISSYKLSWKKKGGEHIVVELSAKAVFGEDGELSEIHGFVYDVTHVVQVENAHREMSELNDTLMQNTESAVCFFRATGEVITFNESACKMVGLTSEEFKKINFHEQAAWKGCSLYKDAIQCLETRKKVKGRTELMVNDGAKAVYVDYLFSVVHRNGNEYLMLVLNDLTEEKLAERAMAQAEQLSSLGELAAGIAHEINSPIAIIMALSGFMRSQLDSDSYEFDQKALRDIFEKIETTSDRIAKIVRGLRSMSRVAMADPFAIESVQKIIDNVVELTRYRFKAEGVQLIVPQGVENFLVECHEAQIVQILVNLVNNAYDSLMTTNQKKKIIRIDVVLRSDFCEMRVTDNGPGIPEHVKKKLMTPFYTTKPKGKGTGLGLSLSKKLAQEHSGDLYLDEQVEGTCFVLYFPIRQLKPTKLIA
ncbi:MAG: sporulation kinase A [Oligoflexia bacterium]|nr:MAG: sporulation kinase A [Oligoflexia bacterium]